MIHYGMTKTAQLAVARGVAETTAGTGVTVNSVLPGPTDSEGVATFVADLAKQRGVGRSVRRGRVLPDRPAEFADPAVRHRGGSRQHDRVRVQPAGLGHQWGGVAGRWRRGPVDRLIERKRAYHVPSTSPPPVLGLVGRARSGRARHRTTPQRRRRRSGRALTPAPNRWRSRSSGGGRNTVRTSPSSRSPG